MHQDWEDVYWPPSGCGYNYLAGKWNQHYTQEALINMFLDNNKYDESCSAVLTPAALCGSIAIVTQFAVLAPVALGVVQAFETGAGASIAGVQVVHVNVVVALAGHAAPTGHQRIPKVTRGTLVTPDTWKGCRRQVSWYGIVHETSSLLLFFSSWI